MTEINSLAIQNLPIIWKEEEDLHISSAFFSTMSMLKPLLDAECGTTSPLIKLGQIYTHDSTLITQDGIIKPLSNNFLNTNSNIDSDTTIEQLVNEYHRPVIAPNTFHLQSLLTNLHLPDQYEYEWTREFLNSISNDTSMNLQHNRFSSSVHLQRMPWDAQTNIPSPPSFILHPDPTFLDQQPSLIDAGYNNDIGKAAQNILFFLEESKYAANTETTPIAAEYIIDGDTPRHETLATQDNNVSANDQTLHSPLSLQQVINHVDTYSEYRFTKTNPFLDCTDPFEEGLKRLEVHDIVNAVLFFEAAVQKQNDHIDAWLCLGITQSENAHDGPAICALKRCVDLDSKKLQAYTTLASCYANEMLIKEAFDSLRKWLINNDKYSHLLSNHHSSSPTNDDSQMIDETIFEELQNAFLLAVSLSNTFCEIDSDLQVCLGILFHAHDDYDKAVECFNTAVLAKPHDAIIWNKLGAAIGNGGHSEKAVDSYFHALTLSPGFIRARYNLGISCFNLNAYKQAVEHFLISLQQQNNSLGPQGSHVQMSETIWHTLSIAIDRLKRSDLEQYVTSKDLPQLLNEFQIE